MSESDTLLAYLSPWFTNQNENIAVEALGYILNKSSATREGLDEVVRSGVQRVNSIASIRTQAVAQDGTRPDLVGIDEEEKERVLIEAKFWADLTPRQPGAYLDRLPDDGNAVLMFVAPEERVPDLWSELLQRSTREGRGLADVNGERKCLQLEGTLKHLLVASWTGLLDRMAVKVKESGESDVESDIQQLRGLAEFADRGRFQPIRESGEDFGPDSQRMRDLRHLIDAATERGISAGWASKKGLNRTPRSYGYGRYVALSDVVVWFGVNNNRWETYGDTPLWIDFFHYARFSKTTLENLGVRDECWIPITMEKGVEFPQLLEDVVSKLESIVSVIQTARDGH